jgi:hypothetical protein
MDLQRILHKEKSLLNTKIVHNFEERCDYAIHYILLSLNSSQSLHHHILDLLLSLN